MKNNFTQSDGKSFDVEYFETDDFSNLPYDRCKQCRAVAFVDNEHIVIVKSGKSGEWGFPGGTIEKGESFEQTLVREFLEEANAKIGSIQNIGYQVITDLNGLKEPFYQLRFKLKASPATEEGFCSKDPDKAVVEVKVVPIKEYKKYFDWGEIGDLIVKRALDV